MAQNTGEIINGHRVLPAYAAYWRDHPEIGLPISDPQADGSQLFEHARLDWKDGQVVANWRSDSSVSNPTI